MATTNDVLEYLYKQGKKDLAEAIIKELRSGSSQTTTILPRHIPSQPPPLTTPYTLTTYY